jgi:hypothetical protein
MGWYPDFPMNRPNFLLHVILAFTLVLMSSCGSTVENPHSPTQSTSLERRYFDGSRWQSVIIQLNQLFVERRMNKSDTSQPPEPSATSTDIIMLRQGAVSVAALEDVAREMRQAQPDIIIINGYVRSADNQQAPAQRLTNKFALRLQAGINPEPLLAKHQARIIEKVSYSADTYLCEETSANLFAVLEVVTALQQESGVIFVTPQIEHMRVKR